MLDDISGPDDVKRLSPAQLRTLAADIRQTLISSLARTGGHLGPNLGCVELIIALHRVFRSPHDRIVFDTGHQSYVHKLLTGRADRFATIRQRGGLSGYPSRAESCHDLVENSHASTALSYADGLAKAAQLRGEHDRHVIAVIGDGALTGGMVWEALNNISAADRPVIIVVNDNGRSYSPTAGGLAARLASLRLSPRYERTLAAVKAGVHRVRRVGPGFYELLRRTKRGMKDLVVPQSLFQDLGLKYVGPIDGHDIDALERSLARARDFGESVIVHCVTEKGRGYRPAETHIEDCLHGTGPYDVETGKPVRASGDTWTSVFGAELADVASERADVVGITAAMLHPTGLGRFAERFPERVFDVGIAEQHATTSAAGLAMGGLHPVVALYATFLNRAFDQVLMDVALHRLPVTFALDRAGVTGDDGPSHNGMWDLSVLQVVPGLGIAAPRDGRRLRELLREAVDVDGPTVVRYPKGALGPDIDAVERIGGMDLLRGAATGDLLLVGVGPMAGVCRDVAARLDAIGIGCTVVDPRWVSPLDEALVEVAAGHRAVAVVEDNGRVGGIGDGVSRLLRDHRVRTPMHTLGIPQEFLDHAKRAELLTGAGLTGELLEHALREMVDCLDPRPA